MLFESKKPLSNEGTGSGEGALSAEGDVSCPSPVFNHSTGKEKINLPKSLSRFSFYILVRHDHFLNLRHIIHKKEFMLLTLHTVNG